MRDDPKIYTGYAVPGGKDKLKGNPSQDVGELKGDLITIELQIQGTYSICNTHVANTDATSHQSKPPEKFLETVEKPKKNKHLNACLK